MTPFNNTPLNPIASLGRAAAGWRPLSDDALRGYISNAREMVEGKKLSSASVQIALLLEATAISAYELRKTAELERAKRRTAEASNETLTAQLADAHAEIDTHQAAQTQNEQLRAENAELRNAVSEACDTGINLGLELLGSQEQLRLVARDRNELLAAVQHLLRTGVITLDDLRDADVAATPANAAKWDDGTRHDTAKASEGLKAISDYLDGKLIDRGIDPLTGKKLDLDDDTLTAFMLDAAGKVVPFPGVVTDISINAGDPIEGEPPVVEFKAADDDCERCCGEPMRPCAESCGAFTCATTADGLCYDCWAASTK